MTRRPVTRTLPAAWVLAGAVLASACSSPTEVERLLEDLERAEARWLETRPVRYTAIERRSCECTPEMAGPVELSVTRRQGAVWPSPTEVVVRAVYVDSGELVGQEALPLFLTAQELFALLRQAVAAGWDQVEADFHPGLGYPTFVSVDPRREVADDEFGVFFEVVETDG